MKKIILSLMLFALPALATEAQPEDTKTLPSFEDLTYEEALGLVNLLELLPSDEVLTEEIIGDKLKAENKAEGKSSLSVFENEGPKLWQVAFPRGQSVLIQRTLNEVLHRTDTTLSPFR